MSALAVPSAVARPATEIPYRVENAPASTQVQQPLQLPASFHTEVQKAAPAQRPYSPPSQFRPEVQTPSSPTVASSPGSIIREIRTVTDDGNPLAIVLAAIALAVALCGVAYAWVRLTRLQRDFSSRALVG